MAAFRHVVSQPYFLASVFFLVDVNYIKITIFTMAMLLLMTYVLDSLNANDSSQKSLKFL